MKIIFFGTPRFSANVLRDLLKHQFNVVAAITKPDKPLGRLAKPVSTPVKVLAETHSPPLPVFQPEIVSAPEFANVLKQLQADLFVVVAYGEILKQHLLDMPKVGCINLHTSLLPKYRGAAPIQRCLINGEIETGVTIMHMAKKMDAGDVIKAGKVPVDPHTTYGELEELLCRLGSKLLLETIKDFEQGKTTRTPQDSSQATFASKIELEDCEINWSHSAQSLHNLVRGVNPQPGAWCYLEIKGQKKRLKVISTRVYPDNNGMPGQILSSNKEELIIGTGQGSIRILDLQLEGKKAMSAEEFMRGIPLSSIKFQIDII